MHGIPYFSDLLAHAETPCAPALTTGRSKAVYWGTYLVCLVLPALLVMPVMYHLIGKESFVPSTVTSWFGEPNTNELASWTLIVAVVLLGVFLLSHFLFGKGQSTETVSYTHLAFSFERKLAAAPLAPKSFYAARKNIWAKQEAVSKPG